MAFKYLFKYQFKGNDCALIRAVKAATLLKPTNPEKTPEPPEPTGDETSTYLDGRYLGPCEAAWRLFKFDLQGLSHSCTKLTVHLLLDQDVYFEDGANIEEIFDSITKETMLTGWFVLNACDAEARKYPYVDIPYHYIWKKGLWHPRKQRSHRIVTRLLFVQPKERERYALDYFY
jgi:hypothetical protein